MNIGQYTFEEFRNRAAEFHGYPAPGLLIGGYMVAMAKKALPEGTLFEATVETKKCLPDAVQMLTLCSAGNNWMKIINLGKYAVSLYDKYTGEGYRVHVDVPSLKAYPEIKAWFLKEKAKKDQDTDKLFSEIEAAGDSICKIQPIRIRTQLMGHSHMSGIAICPLCEEAYPESDGSICRGCQGEAPYSYLISNKASVAPKPKIVPVEESVGMIALHDMTQVIPGEIKGPAFKAGQKITAGDVCRLQQMGRFSIAVEDNDSVKDYTHENLAAERLAKRMAGKNICYDLPPKEGKVAFKASTRGLFTVDTKRLFAFNMTDEVMCATRQDGMVVEKDTEVAATRAIPLYINNNNLAKSMAHLEDPLFYIAPFRKAKVGILVTGTEVFQGLIEDKFIPLITSKVEQYDCDVVKSVIAPDDKDALANAINSIIDSNVDLLITTGGLSVDPDDITRASLLAAGLENLVYGAPVVPGTLSVTGTIHSEKSSWQKTIQVLGVPACALYFKTTLFDLLLPRLLAGRLITKSELALLGDGGLCMNCKICSWPKCFFCK